MYTMGDVALCSVEREGLLYKLFGGRKKEKKAYREIRWDRLDNTAHLFPVIAGENMSNVYRISVTLTELVQPDVLQQALNIVLPKMDGFNLRLRMGVFWYYFEENGKPAPKVREESNFPCRYIKQNQNHSYICLLYTSWH